jgi:hypothetical protein
MNISISIASVLTAAFALGLVFFRLLWAASSVVAMAGLGPISKLPKSWRRWLFDERRQAPHLIETNRASN